MPEDTKKTDKKKHEPKEQRKPRHSRNQAAQSERKSENNDDNKVAPKVSQQPVLEEPGPEFYKNLKRETDEIVKITESENAKYKKKEIQSNWAKYEMPLENYEELDDQDVGADYEKLIQAPLTSGGHFQFKHEKSWDTSTAPTLYNRYFDFNMDSLSLAISTIPFYERNEIDQSEFSETDLLSMNTRASKYKAKYYNDATLSVEITAQEEILKSLRKNTGLNNDAVNNEKTVETLNDEDSSVKYEVTLDFNVPTSSNSTCMQNENLKQDIPTSQMCDKGFKEFFSKNLPGVKNDEEDAACVEEPILVSVSQPKIISKEYAEQKNTVPKEPHVTEPMVDSKANPVIQSPEELEKWLDDFLES